MSVIDQLLRWKAALPSRQRGDTIVEVLIAIIVLSTVLAGAYGVASRSTKEGIQTQEHAQALQIAQGQLETLKSSTAPPSSTPFCYDSSGNAVTTGWTGTSWPVDQSNPSLDGYPSGCQQATNGSGGACTDASLCFHVAVQRLYATDPNLYTVSLRWNGVNGGIDQVRLDYRLQ
jgi:type II secretory pathway pseudopilin PulG